MFTFPEPWAIRYKEMAERGYGGALQVIFFMATPMVDDDDADYSLEEENGGIWCLMFDVTFFRDRNVEEKKEETKRLEEVRANYHHCNQK